VRSPRHSTPQIGHAEAPLCQRVRPQGPSAAGLPKRFVPELASDGSQQGRALSGSQKIHMVRGVWGEHDLECHDGEQYRQGRCGKRSAGLLNLQEVRRQAKAYQVRQLLALIERYNLTIGD